MSTETQLNDRQRVLAVVTAVLDRSGQAWAWQGATGAPGRWAGETGPKDLDVWCAATGTSLDGLRAELAPATVGDSRAPGRLRHVSLAVETPDGPAVVDLTIGDLRVGPVLLLPAGAVTVDPQEHRFTGFAAVADLLVRPLLRGRLPDPARLAEARVAWAGLDPAARRLFVGHLTDELGAGLAGRVDLVLAGARPAPTLARRARWRLLRRSLAPDAVASTWAERRTVVPAGRSAGPLGLRVRGVVVALVGTDGAGKSTVADRLHQRLRRYGLPTGSAYFGMARGNLPGVALARRLVGVARRPGTGTAGPPATVDPRTHHPGLRRAAAWVYAAEYVCRYLVTVAPQKRRRRVVVVDRWVYDLRDSPWPGSAAARVAQFLVPDPDVLVLPDAPIELIHARKPERQPGEQAAQQDRFRRLLAERPARYAEVVVDSSGLDGDPLGELVAVVVEAAHRGGRCPGR